MDSYSLGNKGLHFACLQKISRIKKMITHWGLTRVDNGVSYVQNSPEFHAKRVSYFAKKSSVLRNFVFRETGFSMRKSVSYFAKLND